MMIFRDFEKESEKNPQNRYTAPPQEVIDQIGEEACRPQKLPGASLEEEGDDLQKTAMERVARNKQGAKRKLTEEGISEDKAINRAAYRTATRPQTAAPEAGSLDVMFSSIGALMSAEAKKSQREEVKMSHEASLLNIKKMSRLGALLQLPGTTSAFKMSIQAQMEQIAREMSEPTEAASLLSSPGAPPAPAGLLDISPGAPHAPVGLLSPQGSARGTSSAESSVPASPAGVGGCAGA
jgi:hypothetical protein